MAKKVTPANKKLNDAVQAEIKKGKGRGQIVAALIAQGYPAKKVPGRVTYYLYKKPANQEKAVKNAEVKTARTAEATNTLATVRRILEADFLPEPERINRALAELAHGN